MQQEDPGDNPQEEGERRPPAALAAPTHCVPACPLGGGHFRGPALRFGPVRGVSSWCGRGWWPSRPLVWFEGGASPRPPLRFGFCWQGSLRYPWSG